MQEYLTNPALSRYAIFPLSPMFKGAYEYYKNAKSSFWVEQEIDQELAKDPKDWATLDEPIKNFIKHILAFFAASDGIVRETITEHFSNNITVLEIKFWYDFQVMMEDIHNIVYSKLIEEYIRDENERNSLFHALTTFPTISRKISWIRKWLGTSELRNLSSSNWTALGKLVNVYKQCQASFGVSSREVDALVDMLEAPRVSLARQLFINIIMEGVFFSGSFCAIFWIYSQYKKMPGLAKANEFISRDEGSHTEFGIYLYNNHIVNKLTQGEVEEILAEAVEIEADFIRAALPAGLLGMNAALMTQYIKFVGDQLLVQLNYKKIFHVKNPFPFMEKQSTSVRIPDFFMDHNVSEYGHHAAALQPNDMKLDFSDNFS